MGFNSDYNNVTEPRDDKPRCGCGEVLLPPTDGTIGGLFCPRHWPEKFLPQKLNYVEDARLARLRNAAKAVIVQCPSNRDCLRMAPAHPITLNLTAVRNLRAAIDESEQP